MPMNGSILPRSVILLIAAMWSLSPLLGRPLLGAELTASVVDAETGLPLAARIYLQDAEGRWRFVESASREGSAVAYREQWVPLPESVEKHTTISAHPFRIELAPGQYKLRIERGKEYHPLEDTVVAANRPVSKTYRLRRWVNMAERGWYSGETHVHRRIQELENVQLAEDLNVSFPVTFWTTHAYAAPGLEPSPLRRQGPSPFGPRADRGSTVIAIDATHVMFPRNTEYEIFSIDGKRHTLGAVFILNHKSRFQAGMPPVARIARQAHEQGALLDLDKHSWPWSMMLVPIAKVDLYELANNSVWRTRFGFRRSSTAPAPYMRVERDGDGMTEWGWLTFGFENYYTLLNCGFRLQPTAGTASGVHPVPLGYSRVYVHVGSQFTPERWLQGLRTGRSFVTTGPMLLAQLEHERPGHVFEQPAKREATYGLKCEALSDRPFDRLEVIRNGRVVNTIRPHADARQTRTKNGAYVLKADIRLKFDESSWIVVRALCIGADGRVRFAHTAPWHIEVDGQPVRPRREEVDFLIGRIRDEIKRNQDVLSKEALDEFREALGIYEQIRKRAITGGNQPNKES